MGGFDAECIALLERLGPLWRGARGSGAAAGMAGAGGAAGVAGAGGAAGVAGAGGEGAVGVAQDRAGAVEVRRTAGEKAVAVGG